MQHDPSTTRPWTTSYALSALILPIILTSSASADQTFIETRELSWQDAGSFASEIVRLPQFDPMDGDRELLSITLESQTSVSARVTVENDTAQWVNPVSAVLRGAMVVEAPAMITTCAINRTHVSEDLGPSDGQPGAGVDFVDFGQLHGSCLQIDAAPFETEIVSPYIGDDYVGIAITSMFAASVNGMSQSATLHVSDTQSTAIIRLSYHWRSWACPWDCAPAGGGNGTVNVDDLLMIISAHGTADASCDVSPLHTDGSIGDGQVNIDDVLEVLTHLGDCPQTR